MLFAKNKKIKNHQSAVDPYAKMKQARQQKQIRAKYVRQVHKRRAGLLIALLTTILLICGWQIYQGRQSLAAINTQVTTHKAKLNKKQAQHRQLKLKTAQLKDDDYLQQVIRQKYYYSKDNETIYSLPQDKAPTLSTK